MFFQLVCSVSKITLELSNTEISNYFFEGGNKAVDIFLSEAERHDAILGEQFY